MGASAQAQFNLAHAKWALDGRKTPILESLEKEKARNKAIGSDPTIAVWEGSRKWQI